MFYHLQLELRALELLFDKSGYELDVGLTGGVGGASSRRGVPELHLTAQCLGEGVERVYAAVCCSHPGL